MHQLKDTEKTAHQSFFARLKQATLDQHTALERNPMSAMLMSPHLSAAEYLVVLQRFFGFVLPIERAIYPMLQGYLLEIEKFTRGQMLREDLVALGMPLEEIRRLPTLTALPPVRNAAEAFGTVYVLEGSKMGGQIISRHVSTALQFSTPAGLHFFSGYGRETGPMWNEFRHAMADFVLESGQEADLIDAAGRTFDAFNTWLQPVA